MAKAKRLWVESELSDTVIHTRMPHWLAGEEYWRSPSERIADTETQRFMRRIGIKKPQGYTLYEYEVTAKLVKKIRPPK